MVTSLRLALTALFLVSAAGPAAATAVADYPSIFEKVWRTVDENFYDPGFGGVSWKQVGARYRAKLPGVKSEAEFEALIEQMLGELGVSHTYIAPPAKSAAAQYSIGAKFSRIQDAWIVTEIAPLSDARTKGVRMGDLLREAPSALRGPLGSDANVRLQGCDGRERRLAVRRERVFWPAEHPGWRWSTLSRRPTETIGYLQIKRFNDGAATLADQAMAELKDTDALIIDLRGNSGGNTSALRLASYFMPPGEAPAVALFSRQHLKALARRPTQADVRKAPKVVGAYTDAEVFKAVAESNGAAVFYTEALGGDRYTKPVKVLIDEDTGSAAEGFAWAMRSNAKATFVGRRTAGALLSGDEFDVGGGWKLTVPVHGVWSAEGRNLGDEAISPDVEVTWTRAALCGGQDLALERALASLP